MLLWSTCTRLRIFRNLCAPYATSSRPFTHLTQSLRAFTHEIELLCNIRKLTHSYASFQQPLRNLCAPFTHPDRPGSVLVYILTIGLLVIIRLSRDGLGNVDWSEVSRSVPVSFCAPCLHHFRHSTPDGRGGQLTS